MRIVFYLFLIKLVLFGKWLIKHSQSIFIQTKHQQTWIKRNVDGWTLAHRRTFESGQFDFDSLKIGTFVRLLQSKQNWNAVSTHAYIQSEREILCLRISTATTEISNSKISPLDHAYEKHFGNQLLKIIFIRWWKISATTQTNELSFQIFLIVSKLY